MATLVTRAQKSLDQVVSSAAPTEIVWESFVANYEDTNSTINTSNAVKVYAPGLYLVTGMINISGYDDSTHTLRLMINGVEKGSVVTPVTGTEIKASMAICTVLAEDDLVTVQSDSPADASYTISKDNTHIGLISLGAIRTTVVA